MRGDLSHPHAAEFRREDLYVYCAAGLAILITPVNLFIWFLAGWSADAGDTGIPPAPGVEARLIVSAVLIAAAGLLACALVLVTLLLSASARSLTVRRVIRTLAVGALVLEAVGFACVL